MSEYKRIQEQMQELQKQRVKLCREFFEDEIEKFFTENPAVESFSWRQYTPYFNDGDPCEFGVCQSSDEVSVNDVVGWDVPVNPPWSRERAEEFNRARDVALATHEKVSTLLGQFNEDDLKMMFNDHSKVTVDANGDIQVEEHKHD